MSIDINVDEVERKLHDLQTRARALHGNRNFPLGELATPAFMTTHTNCASLDELFVRGGITAT